MSAVYMCAVTLHRVVNKTPTARTFHRFFRSLASADALRIHAHVLLPRPQQPTASVTQGQCGGGGNEGSLLSEV